VEKLTNDSVKAAVYSGGQLGCEVKLMEGLGLGIVDGCAVAASSLALTSGQKKFYLLDLPFLFDNFDTVEKFANSGVAQQLATSRPGSGVRILGLATAGFHQMLNSKKPIMTPD